MPRSSWFIKKEYTMEKTTPLYEKHIEYGGKIVPFAGYLLPVQFEGVIAEHNAVRNAAGLFDVSHMGEVRLSGADALANLNNLLTNDFTSLKDGRIRYSPMCYDDGGTVDDMIVYKVEDNNYVLVVNAANREKDVAWMGEHLFGDCVLDDFSDTIAQIAIQGPASEKILAKIMDEADIPKRYYSFTRSCRVAGFDCLVSQTGYTGELGFELYLKNADAAPLWDKIIEAGREHELVPCGLGARDTLRLEAGMPLYGHELSAELDPLSCGLDFAIKLDKADFIGKQGLLSRMPLKKVRVGMRVTGRGIVREGCELYFGGSCVGASTSGTHSPYFGYPIAAGYVDAAHSAVGTKLAADVRGRLVEVEIVPLPFYKR